MGGDDGPSVFMFFSCVLIFMWLRNTANKVGDTVSETLELGQNSGGPLQAETTTEISQMEKQVKSITYRLSALRHPKAYFTNIANKIWTELGAMNTSESDIISWLKPMNTDELKCVAKEFGVRERTTFGLTTVSCTIFKAFDDNFTDGILGNDLTAMHKIWAKTGLW